MSARPQRDRIRSHPSIPAIPATPTLVREEHRRRAPGTVARPPAASVLIGLTVLQGIGGIVGMAILLTHARGTADLPVSSLHRFGLHSYVIPGLVLGIPLGLGALVAAYGLWRMPLWRWTTPLVGWTHEVWSWVGAAAVALGVVVLIALEVFLTPIRSPLQWVFGTVAVLMAIMLALPSVRRHYAES